jgi:signal transduction histidine kinase
MFLAHHTIGAKIFGAFAIMSAIIGLMGLAGYYVLSAAGGIAVTTYDNPMMAINYARAAQNDFVEMQLAELQFEHARASADRAAITQKIADLTGNFQEDLDVAAQRGQESDEQKVIAQIAPLVQKWRNVRAKGDTQQLDNLDQQIDDRFELLIEYNADHSFVGRRQTVTNIGHFKYVVIGTTLLALLLAGGITLLLRSRIVRPLRAAATVADRIAAGELQTDIPPGGPDETGALLKSMTVMQDRIREAMTRETMMRLSAENRLADALETSREGVILVAPDGRIALANSMCHEFFPEFGASLSPGTPFDDALSRIRTRLVSGREFAIDNSGHVELELVSGNWLRLTSSRTSEGGSILFLSDFTAIKEREESYRKAKQEAEDAHAAKTRFLANMSHELRTPLNAIIGFSEIISGELFGTIANTRYLEYSHDILRSGRHLLAVINDVLDLVKSESGKMSLNARPIDMREVLMDCAAMMREQCTEAGLRLVLAGIDEALPVVGDPAKLRQIFLNLLSNAAKFTEQGGEVSLSAGISPQGLSVTVGDTGIGMDPQDVEIALQPFGQVDNRLERRYEGTGLGLPLTKALVELHDAAIVIDSARGRGTRITITFPQPALVEELRRAV